MEPDPASGDTGGHVGPPPEPVLMLAGSDGLTALGPAGVDSDADGIGDTVLLPGAGADLLSLATDVDGDGMADVMTTVGVDGTARTVGLPDPGLPDPGPEWDGGWDGDPGDDGDRWWEDRWDGGWDAGWRAPAPPAPTLDPETGAWVRTL